jgi:hypothetical protein
MTALIALAAICLAAAGAVAGLTGVVAVAIRRENRNLTLTSQAPGPVTRTARRLTGLHVRAPAGDQEKALAALARAAGRPWTKRTGHPVSPSLPGVA